MAANVAAAFGMSDRRSRWWLKVDRGQAVLRTHAMTSVEDWSTLVQFDSLVKLRALHGDLIVDICGYYTSHLMP